MTQVIADQLGVSVDDISFIRGDTDAVPVGTRLAAVATPSSVAEPP